MNKIILSLLLLLLFLGESSLVAQTEPSGPGRLDDLKGFKRSGQTAMPFLDRGAGARMMAMGDAGIAVGGDAAALFYNPAGIAGVENRSVMIGNMAWLLDTSIQTAAFAMNLGDLGVLGVSAMYFNYGDPVKATEIDATSELGYRDIGEVNPSELAIGVGYARQISAQFLVGAQVKYAYQDLLGGSNKTRIAYNTPDGWVQEEHDAKTGIVAFDIGTIYNTGFRDLTLAMSFRNFGEDVKYERDAYDIPLTFRFGLTGSVFKLLEQDINTMDLNVRVDYLHPRDWSERVNLGLEYSLWQSLFLRGGYKFNYSSEGLSLGAGVNLNVGESSFKIDYAYKDTNGTLFEAVHVYSLSVDF